MVRGASHGAAKRGQGGDADEGGGAWGGDDVEHAHDGPGGRGERGVRHVTRDIVAGVVRVAAVGRSPRGDTPLGSSDDVPPRAIEKADQPEAASMVNS
jgi:hypothetical protein